MQLRDLFEEMPSIEGLVIPLALRQLLRAELDLGNNWQEAENLLLRARDALPEQLELGGALYKLYAYSNRFDEALAVIESVWRQSAATCGFAADWRLLSRDLALIAL